MKRCESLYDFLKESKPSNDEISMFKSIIQDYKNDGFKNELQSIINAYTKESDKKRKSPLSNAQQSYSIWNEIKNKTDEAYSIMFSESFNYSKDNKYRFFYRGVSNKDYKLAPGIYRNGEKDENYYYHELQVRCPNDLAHLKFFNKLTYMQHYGSPTRLLDITANPLVALYFACDNDGSIDGKVSIFGIKTDDVAYETSDRVQILSHLQELTKKEQEHLLRLSYICLFDGRFPKNTNSKYVDTEIERFYYNIQKENNAFERSIVPLDMLCPVFVQANQDNPRILKQDGAFIMSGLDFDESDSDKKIRNYVIKELIIPARCKRNILDELETICIHKATLFPELEMVSQYLRSKKD